MFLLIDKIISIHHKWYVQSRPLFHDFLGSFLQNILKLKYNGEEINVLFIVPHIQPVIKLIRHSKACLIFVSWSSFTLELVT
jgi:chromosome segregation and condensation protein ScpB